MPNASLAKTLREFCTTCGFPVSGSRCDACGAPTDARPRAPDEDSGPRTRQKNRAGSLPETDLSGLERAFDAFRSRDYPRFVDLVLASEPASAARSAAPPEGSGWIAAVRGSLVFVTLLGEELTLEAPIARLPRKDRVPSLRVALELCAEGSSSARVGLRGQLLLLRFTAQVAAVTPGLLRHYLREIGHLATRYAGLLSASCDALPALPDDPRAALGFDMIGRARRIRLDGRRSDPPEAVNGASDSIPPILAPMFSVRATPVAMGNAAGVPQAPPVAMGNAAGVPQAPPVAAAPKAPRPPPPAPPVPQSPAAAGFDDPRRRPTSPVMEATGRPRARSIIELEGFSQRSSSGIELGVVPKPGSEGALAPPDRLCALLLQARSLSGPTIEARPATMTWLVRSAVFRVIYEFKEVLPDAAAHLYRATGIGSPPQSRSAELAAIEPALAAIEHVIAARAQMPLEAPLVIPPLTSAALAKEHVAAYLAEIGRAPPDPALRHYLAIGALAELLARTKLPPQTDQRLRDIISHAQREGPKQAAIDLLMTALTRING